MKTGTGNNRAGGFCEIQQDWVLMTSSMDQPVDAGDALAKLQETDTTSWVERMVLNIARARASRKHIKLFWLRKILFLKKSKHAWYLLEKAREKFEEKKQREAVLYAEKSMQVSPDDLSLVRQLNLLMPQALQYRDIKITAPQNGTRVAVVIPGMLRCLKRTLPLLKALLSRCDVFICTSPEYAAHAESLQKEGFVRTKIVKDNPRLPANAMQQWMRMNECLQMLKERESETGIQYSHIIKVRTDFYFLNPEKILNEITGLSSGLLMCSDKVFGGKRNDMLRIQEFYHKIMDYYVDGSHWFDIRLQQIERSDDSFKWFGLLLPDSLTGDVKHPEELRTMIMKNGVDFYQDFFDKTVKQSADSKTLKGRRLMRTLYDNSPPGKKVFASEICFAAFLNQQNIDAHWSPYFSGILWYDRALCNHKTSAS
jgi:hypothetical protein